MIRFHSCLVRDGLILYLESKELWGILNCLHNLLIFLNDIYSQKKLQADANVMLKKTNK